MNPRLKDPAERAELARKVVLARELGHTLERISGNFGIAKATAAKLIEEAEPTPGAFRRERAAKVLGAHIEDLRRRLEKVKAAIVNDPGKAVRAQGNILPSVAREQERGQP